MTDANPGANWDRDQCFTVSGGPGVAFECGDLRLAHGLPGVQTYGKARAMGLLYNSRSAAAVPVVAAFVRTPASVGTPTRVTAKLFIGPFNPAVAKTVRAEGEWFGPDFTSASMRRIALTYGAFWEPSGVYRYAVEVTFWNGPNAVESYMSEEGRLVLNNRSASPYGPGWWPAGVEQLVPVSPTEKAWIGADGSTRYYVKRAGENVWDAGAVDRPDYLSYDGTNWIRWAPHRTRILFDDQGQHVATINRFGYRTSFTYVSGTPFKLDKVTTRGLSVPLYQFSYPTSTSMTITAPAVNGQARTTTFTRDADGIRSICDPDGVCTSYNYGTIAAERYLLSATDRRGMRTDFTFSAGYFLRAMTRDAAGTASSQNLGSLGEASGLAVAGAVAASTPAGDEHTVIAGPRGVGDYIAAYLNRFGAPRVLTNAGVSVTQLFYEDGRFPGLVTKTIATNGFTTQATYDASGHLYTTTEFNPHEDGQNPTTTYTWDTTAWDEMTSVTTPQNEVTTFGVDTTTGDRTWQEMPAVAGSRTQFRYYTGGLLRAVEHPTLNSTTPIDSVVYDTLGNAALLISPKGYRTRLTHDGIGQVTATAQQMTPGDLDTLQRDSTVYDAMSRITAERKYGPAMVVDSLRSPVLMFPADSIWVRHQYYTSGDLWKTTRTPGYGQVVSLTTQYRYDALGRTIAEVAPDSKVDSTAYDPAGNVIARVTRNGDTLSTTYDALNRVLTTSMTEKGYNFRPSKICKFGDCNNPTADATLPFYGLSAAGFLKFGAATDTLAYDPLTSGVQTANNSTAHVTRTYYTDGSIKTETQNLRTVQGGIQSGMHEYTLTYRYDRDGRRLGLQVPSAALGTEIQYTYDPSNGALKTVTDVLGNVSSADYNARGERWRATLPGGAVITDTYNEESQLVTSSALWKNGQQQRVNTQTYDARGKLRSMVESGGAQQVVRSWYSGLGMVVRSHSESQADDWPAATFNTDEYIDISAMGDILQVGTTTNFNYGQGGNWYPRLPNEGGDAQTTTTRTPHYDPLSGRMMFQNFGNPTERRDTLVYDAGGNNIFMRGARLTPSYTALEERASFFDAAGHQRVTETRSGDGNLAAFRRVFEESFYDALGRRVLVRTRKDCGDPDLSKDPYCNVGTVRRTIWDGSAELAEIQQPGDEGAPAAEMENDGALTTRKSFGIQDRFNANPFFGTVVYSYGLNRTDQPLTVTRLNYVDWTTAYISFPTFSITPLWNSLGQMDIALFPNGERKYTLQGTDVRLQFPVAWFTYARSKYVEGGWFGSLLEDKQDASGLLYRRNRYYDPMTGRFTQEDPIGLAGGMNVYGFAAGDPVNYSDPFGLCPPYDDVMSVVCNSAPTPKLPPNPAMESQMTTKDIIFASIGLATTSTVGRLALGAARELLQKKQNPLSGTTYTGEVREQIRSGDNHGFPLEVDNFAGDGTISPMRGGDGIMRTRVELRGGWRNKEGTFEWLIEPDNTVNHRFFKPNP